METNSGTTDTQSASLPLSFRKYDRGFCINVLSVIPSASVRLGIVQLMRTKLKPGCPCLFVSLYRNSDFTRMQKLPNCTPYDNGFLMDSLRGHSFYGLIPPNDLAFLVKRGGFEVESVKLDEGTAYLWAKSPEKATEAARASPDPAPRAPSGARPNRMPTIRPDHGRRYRTLR
jgi:hypothetical protein